MKKSFKLNISSDLDYEGMVVEIVSDLKYISKNVYSQELIAVLNQDKGVNNIEIKLYAPENKDYWDFSYNEFIEILEEAKKTLLEISESKELVIILDFSMVEKMKLWQYLRNLVKMVN